MSLLNIADFNARLRSVGLDQIKKCDDWVEFKHNSVFKLNKAVKGDIKAAVKKSAKDHEWIFPEDPIYFLCDLHADQDAFARSLELTGTVTTKFNGSNYDFTLKPEAKNAQFVIGGDIFDKGPSNLALLRSLKNFIDTGAKIDILAGNHDVRTYIGIQFEGAKDLKHAHLFTRMGGKTIPLFLEIFEQFPPSKSNYPILNEKELVKYFFPNEKWFDEFPAMAKDYIPADKLKKELTRVREKIDEILEKVKELGLTLADIYATIDKAKEIFLHPGGEFSWLFEKMNLSVRYGSFLFVHAGVDDEIAQKIVNSSKEQLREWFHTRLVEGDLFDLYHGSIGNSFRTKYRGYDKHLTDDGVRFLLDNQVYSIVHGHLNQRHGQRLAFRGGMLNFQCDCSLDANTRKKEKLSPKGAAFTLIDPEGSVWGYSTDYAQMKKLSIIK